MSMSNLVAGQLPYLRRYARALAGEQAAGDAYVMATLEALPNLRQEFEAQGDPKIGLFRIFTHIWSSVEFNKSKFTALMPHEKRLEHLTPLPRQAFLLANLEGFTDEEGGKILGVTPTRFLELVESAGRELATEISTDVLIIEDEALIALDLESLVEGLGHNVIGIARTHREAVQIGSRQRPGLILADIQLADGSSGLSAVSELVASFQVPVVFITAYPERFLTGQRPEPAFLIAKPFRPAHVAAVISQALFFDRNAHPREARTGT